MVISSAFYEEAKKLNNSFQVFKMRKYLLSIVLKMDLHYNSDTIRRYE